MVQYSYRKDFHALYIDDLAEGEAIDLKKQLVVDPSARPAPLTYNERSGHVLPAGRSILQSNLNRIKFLLKLIL